VLGAWAVRFVAYSALIVSAAIVLVLADVTNVWAILGVIGGVWLLGAAIEWMIWRREQAGWIPYDRPRWTPAPPAQPAPRGEPRPRPSLRLPSISFARRPEGVVEPPAPGTDAPAPAPAPEPMPPPAEPEPAPAPPEPPAAPEPEPPRPEPPPPDPVPEPDEPEPAPPEPDPVPEPEPPEPEVEPAPDGTAEPPAARRAFRLPRLRRRDSDPERANPAAPAEDPPADEPVGAGHAPPADEPEPTESTKAAEPEEPVGAGLAPPAEEPEPTESATEPEPAAPDDDDPQSQAVTERPRRAPAPVRPQLVPQPPRRPPAVVTLPKRAPVSPAVVSLDERRRSEPQEWNVWELERLARGEARRAPERADELQFLLVSLRQFAEPGGLLPTEFDGLVRESFGGLLDELERT
jgi:hypothetical protein